MFRIAHLKSLTVILGLAIGCAACAETRAAGKQVTPAHATLDFNSCAKPVYPHAELAAGHEGTVEMQFLVATNGSVSDSKVSKSSGFPALDEAARSAIAKCRFQPAAPDGKPVQAWSHVKYVWTTK